METKEWVHSEVVAEAVTKKGLTVTVELTLRRELNILCSKVKALSFIQNNKQHDLYTYLYAVKWFTEDKDSGWYTYGFKISANYNFLRATGNMEMPHRASFPIPTVERCRTEVSDGCYYLQCRHNVISTTMPIAFIALCNVSLREGLTRRS